MFSGGEVPKTLNYYDSIERQQCVPEQPESVPESVEDTTTACQMQDDGSCYVDLPAQDAQQRMELTKANQAAGCSLFRPCMSSNWPEGVTVLHVNDVHGRFKGKDGEYFAGGLARMTTEIKRVAEENHARGWRTVVTIAGDVFTGGLDSDGQMVLATLKKMQQELKDKGVQFVAVLGNHAFDHGMETTVKYIEDVGFPVLGANFGYHDPDEQVSRPLAHARTIVGLGGGAELAIVGLCTDDKIPSKMKKKGLVVKNPVSMAASEVAAAKQGKPVATVVLTHIGDEYKEKLAGAVSDLELEVDAIIGGHTHDGRPEYCAESYPDCEDVSGVPYCRVPAQPTGGSFLGRIDIKFGSDGSPNEVTSRNIPLRADIPEDPEVRGFIEKALELEKWLHPEDYIPVGKLPDPLKISRREQSSLGKFTTKAMLAMAKRAGHRDASIALINSGAMRDDLPKGELLSGQVNRVFKYDNKLVVVKVKGSKLREILKRSEGLVPKKNDDKKDAKGDGMYLQHSDLPKNIVDSDTYEVVTIGYLLKEKTYSDLFKDKEDKKDKTDPQKEKEDTLVKLNGRPVRLRMTFQSKLIRPERVAGGGG